MVDWFVQRSMTLDGALQMAQLGQLRQRRHTVSVVRWQVVQLDTQHSNSLLCLKFFHIRLHLQRVHQGVILKSSPSAHSAYER